MPQLGPGDPAPPFDLPDQDGRRVTLGSLAGERFVLYVYTRAGTSG